MSGDKLDLGVKRSEEGNFVVADHIFNNFTIKNIETLEEIIIYGDIVFPRKDELLIVNGIKYSIINIIHYYNKLPDNKYGDIILVEVKKIN